MKNISQIKVLSEKYIGAGQTLKDHLTATDKKIIVTMLNSGMDIGVVRNKMFEITKLENSIANVIIKTKSFSKILNKDEVTKQKVQIKYN